jgi:hypothetical protein
MNSSSKDNEAKSSRCAALKLSFREASARVEQRVGSVLIAPPPPPSRLGSFNPDFGRWELANAFNLRLRPLSFEEGGPCLGAVIQGVVVILLLATHRATERAVRCVRSFIAKSAQGGRSVMPFALFAVNCHYYEYVLTSGHHLVSSI